MTVHADTGDVPVDPVPAEPDGDDRVNDPADPPDQEEGEGP